MQFTDKNLAHIYINCALKNTILSLTDSKGNLYKQWSSKSLKKTDLKKNTPYNIQFLVKKINKYMSFKKIIFLKIIIKGNGTGRYNVIQNINSKKFKILYIFDKTLMPFNGCRQKKQKRR